jgi:hypothetical protein
MLFVPDRMARFIFCMYWPGGTEEKESNKERPAKQRNPKQSPHHDDLTPKQRGTEIPFIDLDVPPDKVARASPCIASRP